MPLEIDLSGKVALVTGTTDGIGLGIARVLAEAGCDIAGCGRSEPGSERAMEFESSVRDRGRRVVYEAVDISTQDGPARLVEAATTQLGGIDLVVSNAGRNIFDGVDGTSENRWRDCIDLDLASHWRLAKASREHLARREAPVFIIIGSNHAYSTLPGCFPYNVAKAGLVAMAQSLALEWGPSVRAVCIAPGFIDTPGGDAWFATFDDPEGKRHEVEQAHPVGRIGTPEEIGGLCAFLASPYAAFISGSTILVDGGHAAHMGW